MIQAVYDKTGLTPEDAYERVSGSREFEAVPRVDDGVHVMLYPKRFPEVKVQILRNSANVWCRDPEQLWLVEDFLNKTFRDKSRRKPFKQPKILPMPGDCRKILETQLGLLGTFVYYNRREICRIDKVCTPKYG